LLFSTEVLHHASKSSTSVNSSKIAMFIFIFIEIMAPSRIGMELGRCSERRNEKADVDEDVGERRPCGYTKKSSGVQYEATSSVPWKLI
jgi:hypothetical protein